MTTFSGRHPIRCLVMKKPKNSNCTWVTLWATRDKEKKRKDFNSHLQPQAQRHLLLWIQSHSFRLYLPLEMLSSGQQTSLKSTDSKRSGMDLEYLGCELDRFSGQQIAWWEKGRVLGVLRKSRTNLLFLVLDIFVESHHVPMLIHFQNEPTVDDWTLARTEWLSEFH